MSELAKTFTPAGDPKKDLAALPAEIQRLAFALAPGQTIAFPSDARLALKSEATLLVQFQPNWLPWSDPQSTLPPPVLVQCGTEDDPGAVFRVSVTRELDAVLLSSSEVTTPVRFEGDFKRGGRLAICMAPFSATVLGRPTVHRFSLGKAAADTPVGLTLGSDPAQAPFAGLVAGVMLLDRDLSDRVSEAEHSAALKHWSKANIDSFYAALGLETEATFARAIIGVARADLGPNRVPGFDFIPRELLWPDFAPGSRWVLESSDHPPIRVNIGSNADHGVYSSFNLFCFTRHQGKPCLWGDGNQWFALEYAADGTFRAVQHSMFDGTFLANPNRAATLKRSGDDRIELVPQGWSNTTEHVFATRTAPFGASFDGKGIDPADLWPARIMFVRVPADYDQTRGAQDRIDQDQPFKGAFSRRLPQIGMSSRGFDPSRLGALNPGASDGAQASEQYYVFQQPADNSKFYRIDLIATPYYLFSSKPDFRTENDGTIAYKNTAEALASESNSLGFNVGMGDTKLFQLGLENSSQSQTGAGAESVLAMQRSRTVKYVLTLDRRWIELTDNFVARVLAEADRVLAGEKDPPPFHQVFLDFGTHYANAITYGSQSGAVQMLDVTTLERMSRDGKSIKAGITIPVEGVNLGVDAGHEDTTGTNDESSVRKEARASIEVGSDEDPVPILLDLRPIAELMQPPYIMDERMLRAQLAVMVGWADYVSKRPTTRANWETPLLLQARLRLISTPTSSLYLRARAFLAGVAAGSDWKLAAPAAAHQADSAPIWASPTEAHLSLAAPLATIGPVVTLSIPRSGAIPAIGFTGVYTAFDRAKIVAEIESKKPGLASPWGGFAVPPPATDAEITAYEHELLSHGALAPAGTGWYGFDALGKPLAQTAPMPAGGFFTDQYGSVAFRKRLLLDGLKPGATFSQQQVVVEQDLVATFDVRLVDPLALVDESAAAAYKVA